MKIYCDGSTTRACVVVEGRPPKIIAYDEKVTSNTGEYLAIIEALKEAKRLDLQEVEILTDSLLIVRQFYGDYACRKKHLQALLKQVDELVHKPGWEVKWIPREENPAGKLLELEVKAK